MKFKVAQAIGLNSDQQAALAVSASREKEELFLAVLQLTCDDAFTRGRQLLNEMSDNYFEGDGGVAARLNKGFEDIAKSLSDAQNFDCLLAAVSGKVLYLIFTGEVSAYLKRIDDLSPLLEVGSPKQLISGFLQEGDRVMLATNSLTTLLGSSNENLKQSLELPLEEWEETISTKVGGQDVGSQGLAGLLIEVGGEVEIDIPKSPEITTESTLPHSSSTSSPSAMILQKAKKVFPKSGRGKLILASALLVITLLGVGWQYKNKQDESKDMMFNQYLQAAQADFSSAQGLQNLNPVEAKNKLDSAKSNIDRALSLKSAAEVAVELKNKINEQSGTILQQFAATTFPLFLDLDLIKSGLKAKYLSLSAGKLLVLDPDSKTLATIDLAKKSSQIISGKDKLGDAQSSSINGGLAFVYSSDKGILSVDISSQKVVEVAKKDEQWGTISDIAGFASNVYLLDSGNPSTGSGQIWKYLSTSAGYSDKREYLTSGTKANLAGAKRMQIESSIYVLKEGGEILRFTKGAADFFSIGGLDKGVKDPKSFFVSSDTDNLYLLDSGNSRLLVLTKTGAYKAQYQGDKFSSAADLVVDEKGKKVYLLEGNKIYLMDLK